MAGECRMFTVKDRSCRQTFEPPGTRSQMRVIADGTDFLALVHLYLRPDGSLGGSGRPDPKVVVHQGIEYFTRE